MCREIGRLEELDIDSWTFRVKDQCWVTEAGPPACIEQPAIDVSLQPAAFESVELMIIWTTWAEGPVRS